MIHFEKERYFFVFVYICFMYLYICIMYFDILMATDELVGTYEFYILFYPSHRSLLSELALDLI